MARKQIKFLRGNTTAVNNHVGEDGSLVINTDNHAIHVQDGVTAGGVRVATFQEVNSKQDQLIAGQTMKTVNNQSLLGTGNITITSDMDKGGFLTLAALEAAHPTGQLGWFARVDAVGSPTKAYYWDEDAAAWVEGGGTPISNSDDVTEGTVNRYYTTVRETTITDALDTKVDKAEDKELSTNDYDDSEQLINYDTDAVFSSTGIDYSVDLLSNTISGILKSKLILPATNTDTVGQEFFCAARYSKDSESYFLYVISGLSAYHVIKTSDRSFSNSKSNYSATITDIQNDWNNKLSLSWDSVSDVSAFITNDSFFEQGKKNKRVLKVNLSDNSNQALSLDTKDGLLLDKTQFATPSDLSTGLSGKVDKVAGKELSTNDYDNASKAKVEGIGERFTTNQSVSVTSKTEWDAAISTYLKSTFANGVKYKITLPMSITWQLTFNDMNCANLEVKIPNGAVVDCATFTNNYLNNLNSFIVIFNSNGLNIYGSASAINATGVYSILVGANSFGTLYQSFSTGQNLELSAFPSVPLINNHTGGLGTPKITGYTGNAQISNCRHGAAFIFDSNVSGDGDADVTLIGSNNADVVFSGNLILRGSSYTGTANLNITGDIDKQSTIPTYTITSGSRIDNIKIDSNNWNELPYTNIQAITPRAGLEFYDTTWKVKVRGNGTYFVPMGGFRVVGEIVDYASAAMAETIIKSIELPFKYVGDSGRLMVSYGTTFTGTSSNTNNLRMYINTNNSVTGATKISERLSSSGLNLTNTRVMNSGSFTNHATSPQAPTGVDVAFSPVYYTYSNLTATHLLFTATCSGLTSDTITLKSVFIDIMPCFS